MKCLEKYSKTEENAKNILVLNFLSSISSAHVFIMVSMEIVWSNIRVFPYTQSCVV